MNMENLFYLSELTDKGLVSREVLEQELLDYAYILLRDYEVMLRDYEVMQNMEDTEDSVWENLVKDNENWS